MDEEGGIFTMMEWVWNCGVCLGAMVVLMKLGIWCQDLLAGVLRQPS